MDGRRVLAQESQQHLLPGLPASHVPSIAAVDYRLWGAAGTGRARTDARCTKINWRSGNPGTVGHIGISHSIVLTSAHALDSVSLAFRYVAG